MRPYLLNSNTMLVSQSESRLSGERLRKIKMVFRSASRWSTILLPFAVFGLFSMAVVTIYLRSNWIHNQTRHIIVGTYEFVRVIDSNYNRTSNSSSTLSDRGNCCKPSESVADTYCNVTSCAWKCLVPKRSIPELENGEPKRLDQNIGFFIETSKQGDLNFRQGCAVESLAYHNPNMTVYVLFVDVPIMKSSIVANQLIQNYKNIRLVSVNLEDYVAGTPLEYWYYCKNWRNGTYHVSHLSDGLRFLTLAKYGGYYFDLDVIQVQPVTTYRNFVAAETGSALGSCAIHADFGHPMIQLAIEDFAYNYRGYAWAFNGPELLMRIMKKWCQVEDMKSMDYVRCRGFHVLPQASYSSVFYGNWKDFFVDRPINETDGKLPWLTNQVIGVHIWNKLSFNRTIYKNSTQYYNRLARPSCPIIYSIAPDTF